MESTARRADPVRFVGNVVSRAISCVFIRCIGWRTFVYLVSPFVARLEPVDGRIVLSLLGLRFIDITMNFMYLNAAWWYFQMLIQFYVLFPIFFLGCAQAWTLAVFTNIVRIGFAVRYWMLVILSDKRVLDFRRLRYLPAARVCPGYDARHVA